LNEQPKNTKDIKSKTLPGFDSPIDRLRAIVNQLRSPGGCPWDIAQTPESITPHIIEEAYELVEAIKTNDNSLIIDELSDQLLHVVMISEMIQERGGFNFDDVARHCSEKMIQRHPHVFGNDTISTSEEVNLAWEKNKAKQSLHNSIVDGIPNQLPALLYAQKLQKKAASVGFDWPSIKEPIKKLAEECKEFSEAASNTHQAEEMGDILFTIVNICRKLQLNAEDLLRNANHKFKSRFKQCETIAKKHHRQLSDYSETERDALWDHAKKCEG